MTKVKVSELMRMSGLSLDELTAKFKQANITIDNSETEIEISPAIKDILMNKASSSTISLKRPKLSLGGKKSKPKPDVKVIQDTESSLITKTTKEDLLSLKKNVKETSPEPTQEPQPEPELSSKPSRKKEKSQDRDQFIKEPEEKTLPTPKQNKSAASEPSKSSSNLSKKVASGEIEIPKNIRVSDLVDLLKVEQTDILKALFDLGIMGGISTVIDFDTASLVAEELGYTATAAKEEEPATKTRSGKQSDSEDGEKVSRPPVVTIMGHVDHGKTSLLDTIRKSNIAVKEAGGITQHIGAYQITTKSKQKITFLDTPGHEAFSAMRARGAMATDVVILVISADDGFMPQTIEAAQHAKAAGAPIIAAVTKIDKEDADIENVKSQLAQHDLLPEEWGGEIQVQPVSSKTGEGIDSLLDAILLQAEMLELKARSKGKALGIVIESKLDKGRGPVATVLVQHGLLQQGDAMLIGENSAKVRRITNDLNQTVKNALPSTPVEIIGLAGLPNAGDHFEVFKNEKIAKQRAEEMQLQSRQEKMSNKQATSLEDLFSNLDSDKKVLNIIIKADVMGSIEALEQSLVKLATDEVSINIISSGVGGINESDAQLARTSNACLIGFNVRADSGAKKVIDNFKLSLDYFSIIYDLLKYVKQTIRGIAGPKFSEKIIGLSEVRDVFRSSRYGAIAGCLVTEGVMKRNAPVRVLRNNIVIYEGKLESLRRLKNDVEEVRNGTECGIGIKDYNDIKPMDQIEAFVREEIIEEDDD